MFPWSCLLLVPMILAREVEFPVKRSPVGDQQQGYQVKTEWRWIHILKGFEVSGDRLVEEVNLDDMKLHHIKEKAFRNVSSIKTLILSNNLLASLAENTFEGLTNLERLDLSNNSINQINNSFHHLSHLKILDLSYNKFKRLVPKDFVGLPKSCNIFLKGNENVVVGARPNVDYNSGNTIESLFGAEIIVKICIKNTKLFALEHYTTGKQLASSCRLDKYYQGGSLNMAKLGISEFQKGWYKLRHTPVREIDLSGNRITRLTSEMFNDLPEEISSVDLSHNKIVRLEKGIIVNQHLREMNFEHNGIIEIEDNVFTNTGLTNLRLSHNKLTNTRFAATLPPTLKEIHLNDNKITEISGKSFSKLNKLENLLLRKNLITKIYKDSLQGLTALKHLDLMSNRLTIEAGSFKDLRNLFSLYLDVHDANEIDIRVFADTKNIEEIYLGSIISWDLRSNTLSNMPNNLILFRLQKEGLIYVIPDVLIRPPENMYIISKIRKGFDRT